MVNKRIPERLEKNWRFQRGSLRGWQRSDFDDSKWRKLNLPHDWSIEGPFDPKEPSGAGGGYLPGGKAWYRKTFTLPQEFADRRVSIEFDGVYMNATVWINDKKVGTHHYGYTSVAYDLTPHICFDKDKNVLAVRVDNSRLPNTRWYSGSGIYRHVWLTVTDNVHVAHWGTFVSTISATEAEATVQIETEVDNDSDTACQVELTTRIIGPDRKTAGSAVSTKKVGSGRSTSFIQQVKVKDPMIWDVDAPALYRAVTRVTANGRAKDDYWTTFGIRTFAFDPDEGFILNGRALKLKGVNLHHDNGCLGAVVYDRAEERRVELMKRIGANAIRTITIRPPPSSSMPATVSAWSLWTKPLMNGEPANGSTATRTTSTSVGETT